MDGWIDGRMNGYFLDMIVLSLFRRNRHFAAHYDLIGISAAYFDLIDVFDVMMANKKKHVSLK